MCKLLTNVIVLGRGNTTQGSDAFSDAECLLKKPKHSRAELLQTLKQLMSEHKALRSRYNKLATERDQAYALLQDKYQIGQDPDEDTRRRATVTDLIGEGYGSQRSFERHKAMALGCVKRIAGECLLPPFTSTRNIMIVSVLGKDVVKQQQLAEAMLLHYKSCAEDAKGPVIEHGGYEWEAHAAIIAGLVEALETLRKRNNGRFPTKDRITQEVLLGAATFKAKDSMLSAIGNFCFVMHPCIC